MDLGFLSGAGELPAALGSFLSVCPGVSTRPFMASSLAAALRAEHLFPRTSGSGGAEGQLLAWGLPCFPVVLTDDVSLPDSPPVETAVLRLSELRLVLFLGRVPSPTLRACRPRSAERVSRCSFLSSDRSESEDEEGERECLLCEVAVCFLPCSRPARAFSSFCCFLPGSGEASTRLFLAGCRFS